MQHRIKPFFLIRSRAPIARNENGCTLPRPHKRLSSQERELSAHDDSNGWQEEWNEYRFVGKNGFACFGRLQGDNHDLTTGT